MSGQVIDLSSPSSTSNNSIKEQFGGITDNNGKVSYSGIVPDNLSSDTTYKIGLDAVSPDRYNNSNSASLTFTVKASSNYNDNNFILAQANRNFTEGLNSDLHKLTQGILNEVRKGLANGLR